VLEKGKVRTWDLNKEVFDRFGHYYDNSLFENACIVVDSYCGNKDCFLEGGTGLEKITLH